MHEALHRFRHNDPDENGKQDTYGWSPDIWHWSLAFVEIFAAYDTLAFDFIERDGKVVWGGILPEAKESLTTLRKWYDEGLLDPDFPLNSREAGRGFENSKTGYTHPVDQPFFYDLEMATSLASKVIAYAPERPARPWSSFAQCTRKNVAAAPGAVPLTSSSSAGTSSNSQRK